MNLLTQTLRRNPYLITGPLRRIRPVFHDRLHGLWILFDFDSVKRALTDHETFSSRAAPPGGKPFDWMIFLDPPLHTKLRAIVMRTFLPRTIASLEPRIREVSRQLLDQVTGRTEMDVTEDYADPLPIIVIAEMLGVDPADRTRLKRWSDAILGLGEAVYGGQRAARAASQFAEARKEMEAWVPEILQSKRAIPQDDLLTRLVEAEVEGERLTEPEILDFFQLLLFAGSETTTNLIGNTILCLLENRDQLALLRTDPDLLAPAIEEVLRYRSPVQLVFRATHREVSINGRTIPEGQLVLAMVGSANRDPKQFSHPGRFDITRSPNQHAGFGHGIHFCIGAALARLEARVALEEFLGRFEDFESAGPWEPRTGLNVYGPRRLPLRLAPRR